MSSVPSPPIGATVATQDQLEHAAVSGLRESVDCIQWLGETNIAALLSRNTIDSTPRALQK
jgi:hypothetical protein